MTFYSFSSGQQLHRQNVLPGNTSSFSLSPSGDYLFRQTNFGEIYRRKDDQKLMVFPNHIRHVRSLVISPDSTQLASSAGGLSTTRIQDLRTGQLLNTIAVAPAQIRFSPDSKYIYDARSGGKALARFDERLAGSDPSIVAVSITTDQHLVLQSFNQSPITVIDQMKGRTEKELQSSAEFENTQFTISPDHSLIASLSQRVIKVWQTESGRLEREIRTDSNHQSIQFSPDSKNIITVDADRGIAVWDPRHVWPGTWIEHADSPMTAIAVAPNGKNTAVGQADGRLFILDLTTGGVQSQLSGHRSAITAVQYSPDGQWIVSGDSDGVIKTWPVSGFEPSPIRLTRERGETLRLAVEGTSFFAEEIVWHKDEIPIANPETQDRQQLSLPSLEARDSGIYRGTMKTDAGQTRTVALALTVLRPTEETQSFEQWVQQFPWGSHSQARDEDADGDQWSNLEEYFLGTHPLEFQTSESPLQIQQGPQGKLMLRIRLAPHARAAGIQLESSPNLNLWSPIEQSLNETVQADGSTHWTATLPNDSVARFIRWKIQ